MLKHEHRRKLRSEAPVAELLASPCPSAAMHALTLAMLANHDNVDTRSATYMECGSAPLCGVLVLQTGLGPGTYHHSNPLVHGLWPETGQYGTSQCIRPSESTADPTITYPCYAQPDEPDPVGFETHEWEKHGECAGVKSAADYFDQVCSLSSIPIQIMTATRKAGTTDLASYGAALEAAGFPVFELDQENSQVYLSACAGSDGLWILANLSDFSTKCPGSGPGPGPSPTPPAQCLPNTHGPPCTTDDECHYPGCVRCANSGFCTNVPKEMILAPLRASAAL